MQKKEKKIPRKKKTIVIRIKKKKKILVVWSHSGQNYLKRASPLCTWMIKQESDGKPCAPKVSGRGLDCPVSRIESLLLSENPHTWLVLNLLTKNLQSLTQWEVRNHKFCLVGTALSKTASRQPFSDFNLIFVSLSFFVSTSKARKIEHW